MPAKTSTYDFTDQLKGYVTTLYDAAGMITKVSSYGPTGLLKQYTTMDYTY